MTARQPRAGGASAPAVGVFIGDPGTMSLARMEEWVRRAAMLQSRAEEAAQYASRTVAQGRHGYLASNLAASRRRILNDFSPEKWSEFQPWLNWEAELQGEHGEVSIGAPTQLSAVDPVQELYWQLYHQENAVEEVARLQKLLQSDEDEKGDAFARAFSSTSSPHSWRDKLKQLVLDARQTLVEDFILLHHLYLHGEFVTYERLLTDLATRLWRDSAWALTHRRAVREIDTVWRVPPILPLTYARGKGGKRPRELSSSSSIEEDAEPPQVPESATVPTAPSAAAAGSDGQLSEEERSINELSLILREMMSEQFQHDHQELEGRARILSVLKKDGDIRTVLKLLRLSLYRAADTNTSLPSGSSEMDAKEGDAREALRKRLLAHGVAEILSQGRTALSQIDEEYSAQLQGSEVVAKKAPPSSSPGSPGPMSPSRRIPEEKTTPTRAEKQKPSPDTSPEKRRSIALRSEWQDRRREICEATAAQARIFIERYVAPAFFLSEQRRRGTVGSVLPPVFAELSPTTTTRSNTNSGGLKGGKSSHPLIAPPIVRLMDVIPIIDRGPGRPLTEANLPSSQLSTDLIQLARLIEEVERFKSSWEQPVEELRKKKNLTQGVIPIEVLRSALGRELNQHILRVSRSSSPVTSSSPSPSSDLSSTAQYLTASFTDPTETPLEHLLRWIHSTESRAAQNFQFPSYTSALQQLSSSVTLPGEGEVEGTTEADAEAQVDIETAIAALEEEIRAGEGSEDEEEEVDAGVVVEDDDEDEAVEEEEVPVEEGTDSIDEEAPVEEDEGELEEEESDASEDAPALRVRPEPARVDAQRHQRGRHRSSSQRSASEGDGGGVSSESAPPPNAGDLDAE